MRTQDWIGILHFYIIVPVPGTVQYSSTVPNNTIPSNTIADATRRSDRSAKKMGKSFCPRFQ